MANVYITPDQCVVSRKELADAQAAVAERDALRAHVLELEAALARRDKEAHDAAIEAAAPAHKGKKS